jgi:hypothetical protein
MEGPEDNQGWLSGVRWRAVAADSHSGAPSAKRAEPGAKRAGMGDGGWGVVKENTDDSPATAAGTDKARTLN